MSSNITAHEHIIKISDRIQQNGFQPLLIWFVGLSGSGKSTLASALEKKLFDQGIKTYILDGDNVRGGLNNDLDFTDESRKENIRRIAEVGNLFLDAGIVVLTAFITPFSAERKKVKTLIGEENYFEVFVDCPIEECEKRDVKGLYQKARNGKIKNFTGIDSPFEAPETPNVIIESHKISVQEGTQKIYDLVIEKIRK